MSLSVTLNGTSYTIPEDGDDYAWGGPLTAYLEAISNEMLQKNTTLFTLSNDVDFGANFGLVVKYIKPAGKAGEDRREGGQSVNAVLGSLRLENHPDKTFIGRIERGFDFLGYHFGPAGLAVAQATIERFVERAARLYEQSGRRPTATPGSGGT